MTCVGWQCRALFLPVDLFPNDVGKQCLALLGAQDFQNLRPEGVVECFVAQKGCQHAALAAAVGDGFGLGCGGGTANDGLRVMGNY